MFLLVKKNSQEEIIETSIIQNNLETEVLKKEESSLLADNTNLKNLKTKLTNQELTLKLNTVDYENILTLQKENALGDISKKRVNIKKILRVDELINKPYSKVSIELKNSFKIDEIKEILSKKGDTEINIIVNDKNKKAFFSLQNNRMFDLKQFKALKAKEYVKKIIV